MTPTDVRPFVPTGNTVQIAATSTSGNVAISAARPKVAELPGTMRVYNAGPNLVWIAQGATSALTASGTTDLPVPAGNTEVFEMLGDTVFVAAICAAVQTATVYFTPGQGA